MTLVSEKTPYRNKKYIVEDFEFDTKFKTEKVTSIDNVEGFTGNSCNEATKNLEDALGKVTVKNKTSDAFISNHSENLTQLNNESNVTF